MVEHTFRDMKSVLDTRPVFHKRKGLREKGIAILSGRNRVVHGKHTLSFTIRVNSFAAFMRRIINCYVTSNHMFCAFGLNGLVKTLSSNPPGCKKIIQTTI